MEIDYYSLHVMNRGQQAASDDEADRCHKIRGDIQWPGDVVEINNNRIPLQYGVTRDDIDVGTSSRSTDPLVALPTSAATNGFLNHLHPPGHKMHMRERSHRDSGALLNPPPEI